MKDNPLKALAKLGQSVWLDYIRRDLLSGGGLRRMIAEDGLAGMTSNPAIFEKAISGSRDYDADINALARSGKKVGEVYETLSLSDIKAAADQFRPLYDSTSGADGYVSLEVNPHLAHDAGGTVREGRRLWQALARPNAMIKVPATVEGLEAVRALIADGINVNVTLLFGVARYRLVAEAYLAGLEARAAQGKELKNIASVASFFISRIDTLVDPALEKAAASGGGVSERAASCAGQVAVASAKAAHQACGEIFGGERFKQLAAKGARAQRLLWASTGTKNPKYSDIKYVEALIGPGTVNTVPLETLAAYRDHGAPENRLGQDFEQARAVLEALPALGVDLEDVSRRLEEDGIKKFNEPFDKLLSTIEARMKQQS